MFTQHPFRSVLNRLHRYRDDTRGSMTVEMVLVVPVLLWAYFAMVIFFDAYRARMEAQAAALTVADLISRQTDTIRADYLEGMNDVYDFLTTRAQDTRLRISSVTWDQDMQDNVIMWSHGTRGLPSLLDLSDMMLELGFLGPDGSDAAAADLPNGPGFGNFLNMIPRADLQQRIPNVLPGEALILVEAFTIWESPIRSWMGMNFLNDTRLSPIAVTRPRFSPFIRSEFDNNVFPEGPPETLPPVGTPEGPVEPEPEPEEPVSTTATIVDTDFSNGVPVGWSRTTVNGTGANAFLGPFGRETWATPVTYAVNLGEVSQSAVIEFDLFVIDSWDGFNTQWAHPEGEFLTILVNGTSIALDGFHVDPNVMMSLPRRTVASRAEGRFTTTMELIQTGNFFGAGWTDQIWRVRIEVENPATQFTLGFAGRLDEPTDNESFGFRSFRITAERGQHGPAHFVPNAATLLGTDPLTRFASYSGCPDTRIPAVNMTMRNSNLSEVVRMRRRAGGTNGFSGCGIPGTSRFIGASPTMVLHYTNDTSDVNGNRLRIRTEDNNNGRTCDSTILIRDPFGQWTFNDDLSPFGWNGGINMGHPVTGEYHIWLGSYSSGNCQTDLRFERY
ncbi:MAG: pilus assembly protein [Natronohydrobacter sp.]|nr:pilus assembly protein [Natronohydrobacter sp.]